MFNYTVAVMCGSYCCSLVAFVNIVIKAYYYYYYYFIIIIRFIIYKYSYGFGPKAAFRYAAVGFEAGVYSHVDCRV